MSSPQEEVLKKQLSVQEIDSYNLVTSLFPKTEEIILQNLPIVILEDIVSYFSYEFCVSMRTLSSSFHEVVSRKFRVGYKSLFSRIRKKIHTVEMHIEQRTTRMRRYSDGEDVINLMMRYSIMRILESEASILKAICHRYIESGKWDLVSSSGAKMLDHFHSIICLLVEDHSDTTNIDPNVTSELLFLSGQFIDNFMSSIEPWLEITIPFEVKLADILDSSKDASVSYKVFNWNLGYVLNANYYLRNLASLEFPWNVFEDASTENKLKSILKTMKNNVRYNNYCHPLREVWLLEDIFEISGVYGLREYLMEPKHYHMRCNEEVPCSTLHHDFEWSQGENGWTLMSDEIHKTKPYYIDVHAVEAEFQLEGGPKPLKLSPFREGSENESHAGACIVNLYVQHPSKCDVRVHKSCLRIEGKNGLYTIKVHDHRLQSQ